MVNFVPKNIKNKILKNIRVSMAAQPEPAFSVGQLVTCMHVFEAY